MVVSMAYIVVTIIIAPERQTFNDYLKAAYPEYTFVIHTMGIALIGLFGLIITLCSIKTWDKESHSQRIIEDDRYTEGENAVDVDREKGFASGDEDCDNNNNGDTHCNHKNISKKQPKGAISVLLMVMYALMLVGCVGTAFAYPFLYRYRSTYKFTVASFVVWLVSSFVCILFPKMDE